MTATEPKKSPAATPKRKPGRPPSFTETAQAKLLKLISEGYTKTRACRKLGIGSTTVDEKAEADPAFDDRLIRARVRGAWARNDYTVDKLRTATNRNIAVVREQAHHCRWESSKLIPRTFGDRIGVDLQADVKVHEEVSDFDLARRFLFAIHLDAKNAPLEKFIESQVFALRQVARCIEARGGGQADYADLAKGIEEVAKVVRRRLSGTAEPVPALPAPSAPDADTERTSPSPGSDSGPSRARARDSEPDAELI